MILEVRVRPRDEMAMGLNEDIVFLRFDPFRDAIKNILASNAFWKPVQTLEQKSNK